ncbi:replication initiator protein A [Bartonella bacilliformis]|uniref:replication initiator protein A n=1 Tax=Bartonella bacilliformis TaxID=774 RepID=UPI0039E245EE
MSSNEERKLAHEFRLILTNCWFLSIISTSGRDYQSLQDALERIHDTIIRTNIKTGDEEQTNIFRLIDGASVRRKHGLDGLYCGMKSNFRNRF